MSAFTRAIVEPVANPARRWQERFRCATFLGYELGWLGSGWKIDIPVGFEFDLSVPWWARRFVPCSQMLRAAALHDYARSQLGWSLWFADLLFLDALHADGVRTFPAVVCWMAVRTNKNRTYTAPAP